MKKVLLMAAAGLVCLFAGSSLVYADDAMFLTLSENTSVICLRLISMQIRM